MGYEWVSKWSFSLDKSDCENIHGQKQCVHYIQLARDYELCGVQALTVGLSRDKRCTCTHTYVYINKQHGTRNNLNMKPARCLSYKAFKVVLETKNVSSEQYAAIQLHVNWAWVTKSFYRLQSCTFPLMRSVCEDCCRLALDLGVHKKKKYNKIQIA